MKLTETAQREFNPSKEVTVELTNIIRRQELSLPALDRDNNKENNAEMSRQKKELLPQEFDQMKATLDIKVSGACKRPMTKEHLPLCLRSL